MKKFLIGIIALLILSGCAIKSVRQQDVDAWVGQPVSELEKHPVFITIPVVKTKTSDGTEIWNYVNGKAIGRCSSSGNVNIYGGYLTYGQYTQFTNCMSSFAACNNIFYIKNNKVIRYSPIGTGGGRCYTTKELQPGFTGHADLN